MSADFRSLPLGYVTQSPVRSRTGVFSISFERMERYGRKGEGLETRVYPVKAQHPYAFGKTRAALLTRMRKIVAHLPDDVGAFSIIELKRGRGSRPDVWDRFLIVDDVSQVLRADSLKNAASDYYREIYDCLIRGTSYDYPSVLSESLWVTYQKGRHQRADLVKPVTQIRVIHRNSGKFIAPHEAYALAQRSTIRKKISDLFTIKIA